MWFKVDDQLAFHSKTVQAGNSAMGLWVRAGAWSCAHLTDGFIPSHMASAMASAIANVCDSDALVMAGLWREVDGGYQFHDWQDFQPTAESARDLREKRSEAGRAGASARWTESDGKSHGKTMASAMASAMANGWQDDAPSPSPSPSPSTTPLTSSADAFDEFWSAYPRKADKGKARRAWGGAVKKTEPSVIIEAAKRYALSPDAKREGGKYLKYPATWLNAEAWENEPANVTHLPTKRRTPEQILDGWMYQ